MEASHIKTKKAASADDTTADAGPASSVVGGEGVGRNPWPGVVPICQPELLRGLGNSPKRSSTATLRRKPGPRSRTQVRRIFVEDSDSNTDHRSRSSPEKERDRSLIRWKPESPTVCHRCPMGRHRRRKGAEAERRGRRCWNASGEDPGWKGNMPSSKRKKQQSGR